MSLHLKENYGEDSVYLGPEERNAAIVMYEKLGKAEPKLNESEPVRFCFSPFAHKFAKKIDKNKNTTLEALSLKSENPLKTVFLNLFPNANFFTYFWFLINLFFSDLFYRRVLFTPAFLLPPVDYPKAPDEYPKAPVDYPKAPQVDAASTAVQEIPKPPPISEPFVVAHPAAATVSHSASPPIISKPGESVDVSGVLPILDPSDGSDDESAADAAKKLAEEAATQKAAEEAAAAAKQKAFEEGVKKAAAKKDAKERQELESIKPPPAFYFRKPFDDVSGVAPVEQLSEKVRRMKILIKKERAMGDIILKQKSQSIETMLVKREEKRSESEKTGKLKTKEEIETLLRLAVAKYNLRTPQLDDIRTRIPIETLNVPVTLNDDSIISTITSIGFRSLTEDVKNPLLLYTMTDTAHEQKGHMFINPGLRIVGNSNRVGEDLDYTKRVLARGLTLHKFKSDMDEFVMPLHCTTLYRGVIFLELIYYLELAGMEKKKIDELRKIVKDTENIKYEEMVLLNENIREFIIKNKPKYSCPTFLSTSEVKDVNCLVEPYNKLDVVIEIITYEDMPGIDVNKTLKDLSPHPNENEFILLPSTRYELEGCRIEKVDGETKIVLTASVLDKKKELKKKHPAPTL